MKTNRNKTHKLKKSISILPLCMLLLNTGCGNNDVSGISPVHTVGPTDILISSDHSGLGNLSTPEPGSSAVTTPVPESTPLPTPEPSPEPTPDPGPEPETVFQTPDWWLWFDKNKPGSQPKGNAAPADLAWYGSYYIGSPDEKVVYLTFDCGYENGNTELILSALEKHNATGTFFMTGHFLESAPDMARKIVEAGHEAGNHTWNHPDMSLLEKSEFQKELTDVADKFYEVTGTEIGMYYRPPEGRCSVDNLRWAKDMGYHTIFWAAAHVDWYQDNQPDPQEVIDLLCSRLSPGAVVLLHNTSQTNGAIIDDLLTKWEELGYSFRPLSELTGP